MDVRNRQQIGSALQKILHDRGGVDVLINNAGLMTMGPCLDTTYEEWDDLFAVNCTGIFNCVKAFAPSMIERRHGSIINIASVSAVKGGGAIGNIWYGASKAAVVALTKGLSREFGPSGIRVNAIAPGPIESRLRLRSNDCPRPDHPVAFGASQQAKQVPEPGRSLVRHHIHAVQSGQCAGPIDRGFK